MATLRRDLPLLRQSEYTTADIAQNEAQQMGDLRRGWEAGRIGVETNSALADLATARANNDAARSAELEAQIGGLRQRQGMYAPRVERVENIDGVGNALDWAQGQVGQGVASMVEPVGAAALATGAGTLLKMAPNALLRGVGTGLQTAGAFVAPYAINQEQLKGEFYGQALQDPTIMRTHTAQQLNDRANLQGAGAAALDSIVPAVIGRGLGGAGLRAGLSSVSPGVKTLGGMALEGTTELGQGEVTRFGLGQLNPNRDTSGDMSDRINEFAGGAIGSGPMTAAGAFADAGFRRTGVMADKTVDFVKEKAGTVKDLYADSAVEAGVDKVVGAGKSAFGWGKQKVVDLKSGDLKAEDIKNSLREKTKGVFDSMQQAVEERSILSGDTMGAVDANDPEFETKFVAEEDRRINLVADKLEQMGLDDPMAVDLFDRMNAPGLSKVEQTAIVDEAATYVLDKSNIGALMAKADRASSMTGKAAGYAGKILGRVGSTAWDITKNAAQGAAKGFTEGRKQNTQVWSKEEAEAELARRTAPPTGREMSLERAKNFAAYLEDGVRSREQRFKAVKPGTDLDALAKYMGDVGYEIADLAEQWTPEMAKKDQPRERGIAIAGGPQSLLPQDGPNFDALTLSLNRIANDLNSAYGKDALNELQSIRGMAAPESEPFFDFLGEQLQIVQSKEGAAATARIRRQAQDEILRPLDPATTNRLMRSGINLYKPEGKRALLGMIEAIHTERVAPGFEKELAAVLGRDVLNGMLQAIDTQTKEFAADLDEQYVDDGGAEISATESGLDMNDDGDIVESVQRESNMIVKQGEKALEKMSGGKLYGFYGMNKPRTDKDRDPFRADKKPTATQFREWDDSVAARKAEGLEPDWDNDPRVMGRPRLIPMDGNEGDRALKLMERRLKTDRSPENMLRILKEEARSTRNDYVARPNREMFDVVSVERKIAEAAKGDESAQAWLDEKAEVFFLNRAGSWKTSVKPAGEIMRERGTTQWPQILSMYRDYMRQEAARSERSESTARANAAKAKTAEERDQHLAAAEGYAARAKEFNADARDAGDTLLDMMDAKEGTRKTFRTSNNQRDAVRTRAREYFDNNGMVVAERMTDRDPSVLSAEDILEMAKTGERIATLARKDGRKILTERNVLMFKSDLVDNKEGVAYIQANQLAKVARERRLLSTPLDFEDTDRRMSNADKNVEFLTDLMDGIAMMMASGHASGQPMFAGRPLFQDGDLSGELMLVTSNYKDMKFGKAQRAKVSKAMKAITSMSKEDFDENRSERAAWDQNRSEERFVPDARDEQEPNPRGYESSPDAPRGVGNPQPTVATFDDLNNKQGFARNAGYPGLQKQNRTSIKPHTPTTQTDEGKGRMKRAGIKSEDDATPLDFFGKQEEGAIRDEFGEQRRQSIMEGKVPGNFRSMAYPKGKMGSAGTVVGQSLVNELLADPATGADNVLNWMRMAAQPSYNKGGVSGGLHLAMPAAVALNKDTIATYDPEMHEQLLEMRKDLARIIRDGEASVAIKVALMKAMAPAQQAEKITSANFKAMLNAIKGEAPNLGSVTTAATRSKREIDAASTKAVADYQAGLKKDAPAKEVPAKPAAAPKADLSTSKGFIDALTKLHDEVVGDGDETGARFAEATGRLNVQHKGSEADGAQSFAQLQQLQDAYMSLSSGSKVSAFTEKQDRMAQYLLKRLRTALAGFDKGDAPAKEAGAPVGKPQAGTGSGKRNAQADPARPATDAEIKAARDFIRKVLGPQIKVDFKDITGYAGEWIEATNTIEIALTSAPGALQVAYHEALHAFFSKFAENNPQVRDVLQSLIMDPELNERTMALLKDFPAAQEQFKTSAEERLAYMFQFWNAGMLDLPGGKAKTTFQKIKEFFRRVLGRVTDSERATAILEAFREGKLSGEPSAAGQVLAKSLQKGTWTTKQARKMDRLLQGAKGLVFPAHEMLAGSDSYTARNLATKFWTNPVDEEHSGLEEGYLNARMRRASQFKNRFRSYVEDLNQRDLAEVAKYLQMEKDNLDEIAYEPQREAAKKIRALLQRFRQYMVEDGKMDIGDRGPQYFPRVWNPTEVQKGDAFIKLLESKYDHVLEDGVKTSDGKLTKREVAERIQLSIIHNAVSADHLPPQREDGVLTPFFAQKEMRELAWLDSADVEPFMEKDIVSTLTQYFHNGGRSAEYSRRFGENGERLEADLQKIDTELTAAAAKKLKRGEFKDQKAADEWQTRQMAQVHKAVGAMEGTLGKDISDFWRKTTSRLTVYQNIRLLPLTLFASVVDPMGMVARGATVREAFETFMRGMKEVWRSWKNLASDNPDDRPTDKWEQLARDAGIVDAAMFSSFIASSEYSSVYMGKTETHINNTFFTLNGMEGYNLGMRTGATKSAVLFLQRHRNLPETHSQRWLTELGLKPEDVIIDAQGELITDWRTLAAQTGMDQAQAQAHIGKIHYALSRWVQGAVLTPNAAQRPSWSSDPHYSVFFHLKQFAYSFHQTVLKRAVAEMGHGNMTPIAALMWYVPVMIASDIMKGLFQGGGELPAHMKGMDAGDWLIHGVERAGIMGVGAIGVDAQQDIFSLAGPAVEQIINGFTQPLGETALEAMPAMPLYKNWVD